MQKIYFLIISILLIPIGVNSQHWIPQAGSSPAGIKGLYFITPQKIIASGEDMFLLSEDGGDHWRTTSADSKEYQTFIKPSFISETTGFSGTYIDTRTPDNYIVPKPILIKTTDGGRSWHGQPSAGLTNLSEPHFIHYFNVNEGILAGSTADGTAIIYKTIDGGLSWQQKYAPTDVYNVTDGQFIDASTGYLVTPDKMIKTTDAGETWSVQIPGVVAENYESLTRLSFSSVSNGWISGYDALFKTTDGGATWTRISNAGFGSGETLNGIHFFDSDHGLIASAGGVLKYTEDGGQTWETRAVDGSPIDLVFINDQTGFAVGQYPDFIHRTNDRGLNWESTYSISNVPDALYDITFNGHDNGFAVGAFGLMMSTQDGGAHWSEVSNPAYDMGFDLYTIACQNDETIWAAGMENTLLRSTDGGQTWEVQEDLPIYYRDFRDLYFARGSSTGWAVGGYFKIMKFDGSTWTNHARAGEKLLSLESIFFLNESIGWIVGEGGTILKTTDGGVTWNDVNTSGVLRTLNDVFFVDENTGWIVGDNDYILKTTDGGVNWHQQTIPHAFVGNMKGVYFSSPHRGWVIGSDEHRGAIYNTVDGGNEWKRVLPHFSASMQGLYFHDLNNGYVISGEDGYPGDIYRYVGNDTGEGDVSPAIRELDFEPLTDTLFNFDLNRYTLIDSAKYGGKFIGRNASGMEEFGEKYFIDGEAWVAGVVSYHSGTVAHPNHIAEFNVFDVDVSGMADRKIRRKDVKFGNIDLTKRAMVTLFDKPVAVQDSFFVSFNLTDYSHGGFTGDVLGVLHTSNNTRPLSDPDSRNVIRIHDHSDRAWRAARQLGNTKDYSGYLAVFPIIKFKASVDATLKSLTTSSGTFVPSFTPATFNYIVHLPLGTTEIPSLTFVTNHPGATTVYSPASAVFGEAAQRTASIVVTAQDGTTTQTYSVVFKVEGDTDATLKSLTTSAGALTPSFTPSGYNYVVNLPLGTTEVPVLTYKSNHPDATVSYTPAQTVLGQGISRTASIVVTAIDGTTKSTYTVVFKVEGDTNAALKSLVTSNGNLRPSFSPTVFNYAIDLPPGTSSVPVISFETDHPDATTQYTPALLVSGDINSRTAHIEVTAVDGITTSRYKVVLNVVELGLDTLMNHAPAAPLDVMKYNPAQGWGYILGHNYMFRQQYAEKYYIDGQAEVSGVIAHLKGRYAHSDTLAEFNVFASAHQVPGARLGGKKVPYSDLVLNGEPTTILFDDPIVVADSFYVSFNLFDYAHGGYEGDTIGMYMSRNGSRPSTDFRVRGRNVVQRHNHEFTDWIDFRTQNFTPYASHFALYPIVKFSEDIPTAIGEQYIEQSGLRLFPVYPNPANTLLTLNYAVTRTEFVSIDIVDTKGIPVSRYDLGTRSSGVHHDAIDVTLLDPGTYIYVLRTRTASLASKFIVIH